MRLRKLPADDDLMSFVRNTLIRFNSITTTFASVEKSLLRDLESVDFQSQEVASSIDIAGELSSSGVALPALDAILCIVASNVLAISIADD